MFIDIAVYFCIISFALILNDCCFAVVFCFHVDSCV